MHPLDACIQDRLPPYPAHGTPLKLCHKFCVDLAASMVTDCVYIPTTIVTLNKIGKLESKKNSII